MPNKISERFGRPRVLLPVIHCIDLPQVRTALEVARAGGADGVFLIDQGGMRAGDVAHEAQRFVDDDPGFFVGANLLGRRADVAIPMVAHLHALWSDDSGVDLNDEDATAFNLARLRVQRRDWDWWRGLFFGGVAFKHQAVVAPELYGTVARLAAEGGVDVVTTSGPKTGTPPEVDKVRVMRAALGDHALAIASGITPENVGAFLPFVDAYLVATGIESADGVFDPAKLRALADAIHAFQP